jgi:predicted nucleic acid-binding Zn ribbon protein
MPIYIFEHPETGEIIEAVQRIKEPHIFTDDEGTKWQRIFTSPNAAIDTKIDPFSSKDFAEKTKNKSQSLGDLWDRSKELSQKREKILGHDPVKKKHLKDYAKKRKGTKHPEDNS